LTTLSWFIPEKVSGPLAGRARMGADESTNYSRVFRGRCKSEPAVTVRDPTQQENGCVG